MSTSPSPTPARKGPGRPRGFDRTLALQAAMRVFWKHGFDGTSYPELMIATGMSKPTLYANFGDKVNLFREATMAYLAQTTGLYEATLNLPTARAVVEACFRLSCGLDVVPGDPVVCFLVQGAMTGSADTQALRDELTALRRDASDQMRQRLERASDEGDLPADTDVAAMAEYVAAVATGLSVQAQSGTAPSILENAVRVAMRAIR